MDAPSAKPVSVPIRTVMSKHPGLCRTVLCSRVTHPDSPYCTDCRVAIVVAAFR